MQLLGSETPQKLSRQLMPRAITLHVVHAHDSRVRPRPGEGAEKPAILSVAEVVDRRGGTRFERPLLREQLIGQLLGLFSQDQANLLLLGEAGVGKTTVLVEAIRQWLRRPVAERILQAGDSTNDAAQTRKFWLTSGHRLIAGMKYLGQWEERCEKVIDELGETRSVLCVDNLLELVRLGGDEPGSSVAAFLGSLFGTWGTEVGGRSHAAGTRRLPAALAWFCRAVSSHSRARVFGRRRAHSFGQDTR